MIRITEKSQCCGCQACAEKCPKQCIKLSEDSEGFIYPSVNLDLCVDCHLCEKVCPVLNKNDERKPLEVFAAKNNDEGIRRTSSSGGIFTMLAEIVIKDGGVVFGVKWNDKWEAVHDFTESLDGIKAFQGSKYVQSNLNGSYRKAEEFLKQGRLVMFTGTPCQISALKHILGKEYDNLFAVDCICHGVPSNGVFRQYLKEALELSAKGGKIPLISSFYTSLISGKDARTLSGIFFRDKVQGWKKYRFTLLLSRKTIAVAGKNTVSSTLKASDSIVEGGHEATAPNASRNLLDGKKFTLWRRLPETEARKDDNDSIALSQYHMDNIFFHGFNTNLYLRPSCYSCSVRGLRSGSDITLGDFWGVNSVLPNVDDDIGLSAITVNTKKGKSVFERLIGLEKWPVTYKDLYTLNHSIISSDSPHEHRGDFFKHDDWSVHQRVLKYCQPSLKAKIRSSLGVVIRSILGDNWSNKIRK